MLRKKFPTFERFLWPISRRASHLARQQYDVIVVGGGHAGTEAAAAASRVGAQTLLVTQKVHTIGALSCNPSLGGVGKGHLVKEVDALDGVCGRAGDWAGIHFSILNRRKGPAVWGPRAQLDRQRTGTFLSGSLFMGQNTSPGGRIGDAPSSAGMSHTLRERLGLKMGRLRTGTPPRIVKASVDFDQATLHPPDSQPSPFSFLNSHTHCKAEEQLPCYLTYTTPGVDKVVKESLHLNCHIQQDTKGPRYCPSIESRVLRFPGRQHQVWLEPEGLTSDLVYPQGLSMTMPPDMQLHLIREIPALHRAEIHTPGYGVQYDFVCPTQLSPALQVKSTQGLFLAGQINGTTGYEEAAAQGLWAGVNAARAALCMPTMALSRTESYIGVLIDDLVTRGVTEPYRMFTSRAEFRTSLRPDNADLRLTLKGFAEVRCVSSRRYQQTVRVRDSLQDALAALRDVSLSTTAWRLKLPRVHISEMKAANPTGLEMLQYNDATFEMLVSVFPECLSPYTEFSQRLKIEAVYRPHCVLQQKEIERIQKEESMSLPHDLDYLSLPVSLSQEVREILDRVRPSTLGAATRLQGVTPAAIVHLFNYVIHSGKKEKRTHRS